MTPITLVPVTRENYGAVMALSVTTEQSPYVAPNVRSLADCWAYPTARPFALTDADELVGFVLLYPGEDIDARAEITLTRLMIDASRQGRGLGRAALAVIVDHVREQGYGRLLLSVLPDNRRAVALYESAGFVATGKIDEDGEAAMYLDL